MGWRHSRDSFLLFESIPKTCRIDKEVLVREEEVFPVPKGLGALILFEILESKCASTEARLVCYMKHGNIKGEMQVPRPFYQDEWVTLYNGDARHMEAVPDASVHLIITSPPYWDLKNYESTNQMGLGQSYEEYLTEIETVAKECYRVLSPGRFLCWVIGTRVSDGGMKHIPGDSIRIFEDNGFVFKKEIIWVKPRGTQGLWQRGTTQFLKDKPFPTCANINIQHEYILILQRFGSFELRTDHRLSESFIKEVAWSIWELPVSLTKGHPAPFPLELPRRLILLYSWPGETVLDPFVGTGTTLQAARELGRKGIGYEISESYCQLARRNLASATLDLQS